jgi:YggT family protein
MIAASAIRSLVCLVLTLFTVILLIRVIISWAEAAGWRVPDSGAARAGHDLVVDITEPLLVPLRRILPPMRMIDGSVLAAFVILIVVRTGLGC